MLEYRVWNRADGADRPNRVVVSLKTNLRTAISAVALTVGVIAPVLAWDGMAIEVGQATRTDMTRIAAQWQWPQRWLQHSAWHLGGYWDVSAAHWKRDGLPGERQRLTDVGLTPVFRLQANDLQGIYLEAGMGAHLLSATDLGNKRFGSNLQFGEHLGIGYRFGARGAVDVGYRYQHLSNADIKNPNHGIEFHQIRLQYWFR